MTIKKINISLIFLFLCGVGLCVNAAPKIQVTATKSDLQFNKLSSVWDEAMPLGNATVGELVWQKGDNLRFSLDHSDLWDLRPIPSFEQSPNFRYRWVQEKIFAPDDELDSIHSLFDAPYAQPGPSKIPCAALEFPVKSFGKVVSNHLYLRNALCMVKWQNGVTLRTFVHATQPIGWFVFDGVKDNRFKPEIAIPAFSPEPGACLDSLSESDTRRLQYEPGTITRTSDCIVFHQKGWGNYSFDVVVKWERKGSEIRGVWCITTSLGFDDAMQKVDGAFDRGVERDYLDHMAYWNPFWKASMVIIPDEVLQKQYDNETYRLGSTSRADSRPISLQAIWTADEGKLPPWKGDYHNDLNTQLSYWPVYAGNHLAEGMAYINTNWNLRSAYRQYARKFFEVDGIQIPGVATLDGRQMGGWVQYSSSPTTAAWIAQHFYLQWKFSADEVLLREKAYPFVCEVCRSLEEISRIDSTGYRTLPLSASPEIFDNTRKAWLPSLSNFDNSLMRFVFGACSEMAENLGRKNEAAHWHQLSTEMPPLVVENGAFCMAKGIPYNVSHRHFSHLISIFPLGLVDMSQGPEAQAVIRNSIKQLDEYGSDWWTGYSFSWLGCLKARAFDGDGAAKALRIFAQHFCLPNTFHANGDQDKCGMSKFTYRPVTLEGNFAFACGIQQMLLQGHTGIIKVFPAIPSDWKNVSYTDLRTEGAFLVSATMKDGKVVSVTVDSEKGGDLSIQLPGESQPHYYNTHAGQHIVVK